MRRCVDRHECQCAWLSGMAPSCECVCWGGVDQTIGHLSVQIFPSGNLLHRGTRRKLIAFKELLCCNSWHEFINSSYFEAKGSVRNRK